MILILKHLERITQKAISGNSGIYCFDSWGRRISNHRIIFIITQECGLQVFGFLHLTYHGNWVLTFFIKIFLDADPASNTLSWRWVAGLQTEGKIYLATEENIEKFSTFKFSKKPVLEKKT